MPKTQPYHLPRQFDSALLAKQAIPGEPFIVVKCLEVASTSAFQFSDRNGRVAIFRYDGNHRAHILKVPASVWNARNGAMAHDFMIQRCVHPLVVTVEVPPTEADEEAEENAAVMAKLLADYRAAQTTDSLMLWFEKRKMAAMREQLISKSQDGQEAKSSGPYPEAASASLAPATTFEQPQEGTVYQVLTDSPEMDAPGNSEEASDVVVGQAETQPGASATFSPDGSGTEMPTGNAPAPLYSRAWDKLESPMRLKELAAVLGTDADTLKASIQAPLSTVELGHAGWVKRREPT